MRNPNEIKDDIERLKKEDARLADLAAKLRAARAANKATLKATREELKKAREAEKAAKAAKAKAKKEQPKAKAEQPKREQAKRKWTQLDIFRELMELAKSMFNKHIDSLSVKELGALRRRYALENHPDKGGELEKLQWANAILDIKEKAARSWRAAA